MKKSSQNKSLSSKKAKGPLKPLKLKTPKVTKVEEDFIASIKDLYVEEPLDVYACQYSDPTSSYTSPRPYTC